MNTRRKMLLALSSSVLAAPLRSFAQPQNKVWRIGLLSSSSATAPAFIVRAQALRAGLRDLGYVEGRNIVIDSRWADGMNERLSVLASELVDSKVDVLVTQGTSAALAAKKVTTTVPIVMGPVVDPVASGLVDSLAKPGGNITGITYFLTELCEKRLELLKEIVPRTRRVAFLMNADNQAMHALYKAMEPAAKSLKLELHSMLVRRPEEIDSAFQAMASNHTNAVVIVEDPWLTGNAKRIVDLATKSRILSISSDDIIEPGGLAAYGINFSDMFRYLAMFVDKILKGAKPADLPVERPVKFEFIVNLKTAKALGVKIPQTILVRADKVIE